MQKKIKILIFFILTILTFLILYFVFFPRKNYLQVDFLDVGQGDSALITTPNDFQILVDGGPDSLVLDRLRQVMSWRDRTIDWLILSHADSDHITGLIDVINDYQINRVIMPDYDAQTDLYEGFIHLVNTKEIEMIRLSSHQILQINQIELDFFGPTKETLRTDVNNASIVFQLRYGEISFLFTGDIEEKSEQYFVKTYHDQLNSLVFKTPHHGSKSSSSVNFLECVSPMLAVISVGENNNFGHPNDKVLFRYNSRGISVWRTDVDNTVRFSTDGDTIWRVLPRLPVFPQLVGKTMQNVYNERINQ